MTITRSDQLSTFVKKYRATLNMTQADVAKLVGIRVATVSNFENRPESCKLETVFKILSALSLQIDITARSEIQASDADQWNEGITDPAFRQSDKSACQ